MTTTVKAVPLSKPSSESSAVKTCALFAFRSLRAVAEQAKQAPGYLAQATGEVRDAWRESARPNV